MTKPLGLKHAAVLLLVFAVAMAARMRQMETESEAQDALTDAPVVDTSTCESIPESDRRHHCLALALNQTEHCDAIGHGDTKHLCRAQVTEDALACVPIQDVGQRQDCIAMLQPQPTATAR